MDRHLSVRALLPLIFVLLFCLSGNAAAACGGLNQRACCFLERLPSCDPGLIEVAAGEYPEACGIFPAGTCVLPTPCGGPGERGCCNGLAELSDIGGVCDTRSLAPLEGCVGENCWCAGAGGFFGGKSLHTCAPERAQGCGGEGQRACCVIEGGLPCVSGTTQQIDGWADEFVAVSGDATCTDGITYNRSIGTCVKSSPADIGEPSSGWNPPERLSGSPMRGYLDLHLHLLADKAHGGGVFVGEPAPRDANGEFTLNATYNINSALSPEGDLAIHEHSDHGLGRDTIGDGTKDGTRSQYGAPYFSGWPKWTSTTHQQAYYAWLERAWRGGLRAVSMLAVTNEALCKSTNGIDRWGNCENSMGPIIEQLQAAWKFQAFIDDLADGEINSNGAGEGWFRIVTSPQQAREVIASGKLAVILGIEVDNLFNCKESGCPENFGLPVEVTGIATPTSVEEAVDVIYQMGVRHVFPVHNFDNAFGAAATWQDAIGVGQAVSEQRWWEVEDCGNNKGEYGYWIDNAVQFFINLFGFGGATPPIPTYTNGNFSTGYASCNALGMQFGDEENAGLGQRLVQALMQKGILIDIDHMSRKSINDMLALSKGAPGSEAQPYPLIASHVQFFDRYKKEFEGNKGRHERMRTRAQLEAIRDSGGMIGAMLKDDVQDTDLFGKSFNVAYGNPEYGNAIANDCRYSSKTWAQAYQYAVDVMDGPVAMGSDFNGVAGHLGPRFGSDACGGWEADNGSERAKQEVARNALSYPFELAGFGVFDKQTTGFKHFDYNVDGLAHIGLLPDFVADLRGIGLDNHYMDKLFCSAEALVRVWERAEALAQGQPDPANEWQCDKEDAVPPVTTATLTPFPFASGWHNGPVEVALQSTDIGTGVHSISYRTSLAITLSNEQTTDLLSITLGSQGVTRFDFFATDKAGNVEPLNTLNLLIDSVPPQIVGSREPEANEYGWNNTDVAVSFVCDDLDPDTGIAGSGVPLSQCGPSQLVTGLPTGLEFVSVNGHAQDLATNIATTAVGPIRIDKVPPTVNAMASPSANAAGWNNTDVLVSFACADALSGIQSCAEPILLATEGSGQSATGAATDRADNSASTTLTQIAIDKTPPEVQITGVSADSVYILGDIPSAGCSTADGLSGVEVEAVPIVSGGTANGVGRFTALCTGAQDVAGNTAQTSLQYEVHYLFSGFFAPIENLPVNNSARAGQTIPIKFGLAGNHGMDILPGGSAMSAAVSCSADLVNELEEETFTSGSSQLQYDAATDSYQYNWKTDKAWRGSCRLLRLSLDDGTVHEAMFAFK
ncbi:PxKF domain-containing protein [Microbulbifer marinus]|nr:PxKF domain-containing protein [Microbulbifer marinus]